MSGYQYIQLQPLGNNFIWHIIASCHFATWASCCHNLITSGFPEVGLQKYLNITWFYEGDIISHNFYPFLLLMDRRRAFPKTDWNGRKKIFTRQWEGDIRMVAKEWKEWIDNGGRSIFLKSFIKFPIEGLNSARMNGRAIWTSIIKFKYHLVETFTYSKTWLECSVSHASEVTNVISINANKK